jgi:hypothetical protein
MVMEILGVFVGNIVSAGLYPIVDPDIFDYNSFFNLIV